MHPIALIYTDFHSKQDNLDSVIDLCQEARKIAKDLGIKNHIWLGDIFDNRISQRQDVLNGLTSIIEKYDEENQKIYCVVGNHDKSDYTSSKSFLHPYKYHPSFDLIDNCDYRSIGDKDCFFLPYFTDDLLISNLNDLSGKCGFLFGHFSIQGSQNQGKEIESSIPRSLFESFDKVFLGHFHNFQQVSSNIFHLGSLQQGNFGEDDKKGFWLLYDNGELEHIPSKTGQSFKKIEINLSNLSQKQATILIEKFQKENPTSRLRIELVGESSTVKAFDKTRFQGIDIKKKYEEVEINDIDNILEEVKILSNQDVVDKFKSFCDENQYNYNEGLTILNEILCQ